MKIESKLVSEEFMIKQGWRKIHHREYIKKDMTDTYIHFYNGNKEWEDDEEYDSKFTVHNKNKVLYENSIMSENIFKEVSNFLKI